eukprot:133485-Hanusia_phi.AAC.1
MSSTNVGGGSVVANALSASGNRALGDVGSTEVVHAGGVPPPGVDGRASGEHALVAAAHAVADGAVGVRQPGLGSRGLAGGVPALVARRVGVSTVSVGNRDVQVGSSEVEAGGFSTSVEVNSAGVGSDAGAEGLEVVDGLEHLPRAAC